MFQTILPILELISMIVLVSFVPYIISKLIISIKGYQYKKKRIEIENKVSSSPKEITCPKCGGKMVQFSFSYDYDYGKVTYICNHCYNEIYKIYE